MYVATVHLVALAAQATTLDCWPVSRQLADQVVNTPMNDGNVLVVVEDSVCDASGNNAPVIHPEPIVPVDSRRELTPYEIAVARMEGRDHVPLGPADFQPITESVVASVDAALGRVGFARVARVGPALRVVAGESAFLEQLVDVKPEVCPAVSSAGWTIDAARYCILDQITGGVFAPRRMFPGWAADTESPLTRDDIPLLDALIQLYTVNGVPPSALFFLSRPGNPERRRLSFEVAYPLLPPVDHDKKKEWYPGAPENVYRAVPGDDD